MAWGRQRVVASFNSRLSRVPKDQPRQQEKQAPVTCACGVRWVGASEKWEASGSKRRSLEDPQKYGGS